MPRVTHLLTADEQRHLQSYNAKSQTLRDLVRGVARGYHPAVYLTGRAGIGKTHTVMEEVERSGRPSTYRNARISPAGLFELFDQHADDVADLFKVQGALQILQGALDSKTPRRVTRTVHGHDQTVNRLRRWVYSGSLKALFELLTAEPDLGEVRRVLIDSTTVRAHQHAAGARRSVPDPVSKQRTSRIE